MKAFGIAGWSGSGKTTLIEQVIPELVAAGLTVSIVKHAHHGFDMDKPGKDSWRHREAGAHEVMILSDSRWVLMHELRDEPEPSLEDCLATFSACDVVLIEGFKRAPMPKLEVHRPSVGKARLYPDDAHIVAVACDTALPDCPLPVLDLNRPADVAAFIVAALELRPRSVPGMPTQEKLA